METSACDHGAQHVSGLIVDDGDGHYFAIAWSELESFLVPAWCQPAVETLVQGAEPAGDPDSVRGYAGIENPLVAAIVAQAAAGGERPAVRRVGAWALLE